MKMFRRYLPLFLLVLAGCESVTHSLAEESSPTAEETLLGNLPTNSDQRCVGIALVAEALLAAEFSREKNSSDAAAWAERIYRREGTLVFPREIKFEGKQQGITSKSAVGRLCDLVAAQYKHDFTRLFATAAGRAKLLKAQNQFVSSKSHLLKILAADSDQTEVFFGSGIRYFPDGSVKDTHHAFLIRNTAAGELAIIDPNDPAALQHCEVSETTGGLTIQWSCRYRDTGKITRQSYRIVPQGAFFRTMRQG